MNDQQFYGIYPAICKEIADPQTRYRIKVKCQQVWGDKLSNWVEPCLPVTSNDHHPDHKVHTSPQVVALILDHSGSTSSAGDPSHTHTVTFKHNPNSQYLEHPHITHPETVYDQKKPDTHKEHTLHRRVPKLDQVVWLMFQGGDPNFPVWIGVGT